MQTALLWDFELEESTAHNLSSCVGFLVYFMRIKIIQEGIHCGRVDM